MPRVPCEPAGALCSRSTELNFWGSPPGCWKCPAMNIQSSSVQLVDWGLGLTLRQAIELLKTTTTIATAITIPNLYYGALCATNTTLVFLRNTL